MRTPPSTSATSRSDRERTRPTVFTWRWWRRLVPFPTGMGPRALASLFLVTFGFAVLAPPCEMHDSMHGAGHATAEHTSNHDEHGQDDRGARGECTCLDDCHLSATLAITSPEASLPRVDHQPRPVSWKLEIRRAKQPFVLPFATAPPING